MKVAMFVNNTGNGDLRVHRQASLLARNGFEVRLFCFLEPGLPEKEERAGYTIVREDQRPRLTRFFDDRLLARFRRRAPAEVLQAPAEVELPPDREPVRPCPPPPPRRLAPSSPAPVREHRKYVETLNGIWADAARRWKPDVCHAHDADTLAAAGSVGVALVYDAHELWSEQPFICDQESVDYWNRLEGEWIRKAACVFTVNRPLADVLFERYGVRAIPLHNCQSLQPRPAAALRTGPPVALYQGVFAPDRGLEELLAASAHLGDVVVAVRGFGEREAALRELASRYKLPVQFWPAVPAHGIVAAAAEADVAVIPFLPTCLNHYLSTPNKLFEAMMAGVPIAGSDIPELRSFVLERGLGVLFDPYSPRDIARALRELCWNPERRALGDAARSLAEREFHWDHEGGKLLTAYQELAGRGKTIARHER